DRRVRAVAEEFFGLVDRLGDRVHRVAPRGSVHAGNPGGSTGPDGRRSPGRYVLSQASSRIFRTSRLVSGMAAGAVSGSPGQLRSITPDVSGSLPVKEGADIIDRLPDRVAMQRIGGRGARDLQPARQMQGRLPGGDVLDAHLGEVLV